MPIHDTDPERRNLLVTSVAFVVFYLAGGAIDDEVIRLQVVNVRFENPEVLGIAAWIILLWFAYRYWITHRGKIGTDLEAELSKHCNDAILARYIQSRTGEQVVADNSDGLHVRNLQLRRAIIVVILMYAANVGRNVKTGRATTSKDSEPGDAPSNIALKGVMGRVVSG